ncbi:MAG: type pilus assembly PilZ [Deltaproteobacteria bacterium]|nr:type pilus assembly PilZ [Deltaproteobacteria bacterium]
MPVSPSEYEAFLRPGDVVTVGIDLPQKTFAEDFATVVDGASGGIVLQLCGNGFPAHLPITGGLKTVLTRAEGKTLFHCTSRLQAPVSNGTVRIAIPEKVVVRERREYLKADVMLPVNYYLPDMQDMGKVIARWDSMRGCRRDCNAEVAAVIKSGDIRVNLGGSGLRFKIRDCLSYGTLLHLHIALPGAEAEHIHAVGSIIRTKELLPEMDHIEYYSTSMAFRMIESSDRLKLLHYIFAEQHKSHAARPSGYLCTG